MKAFLIALGIVGVLQLFLAGCVLLCILIMRDALGVDVDREPQE